MDEIRSAGVDGMAEVRGMQIGVDSFAASIADPATGWKIEPSERLRNLVDEIALADAVGLDVFGVGEHHREEFLDSAPTMILAAGAARTKRIRLSSAVTVLSAADPVRVFQEFATLDLLSGGRAEMVVGRGSFTEAYPLFGLRLQDYDELFVEKLELLLQLRAETRVSWSGAFRPALKGVGVYPRPVQAEMPVWVGVGGTPESFARAGAMGLPLMVAIIGGQPHRFRPLVDLYREAGARAGHAPDKLKVGLHMFGFLAETVQGAADDFYPGYATMMSRIGKERGWPPITRAQYDATRGVGGAFLIGSPEGVVEKVLQVNEDLGGVARLDFQMTSAHLEHGKMLKAIELLGERVAPAVRKELGAA